MRLGLKPVGDNGTYFQNMEINTADIDQEHTSLSAKVDGVEYTYRYNEDFHWVRQSLHTMSAEGPVVFAGYGIDAPEYVYNDFADLDVKGKVVLVLNREPQANDPQSKFVGTWDTYHAFSWQKLEELRKRCAAGLLLIQDRVRRDVKVTQPSSPRASGGPSFALAGQMWDIPTFLISREIADQLLAPASKTCDQLQKAIDTTLQPASFDVAQSTVSLSKSVSHLQIRKGRNVVAMLEGSDPKLKLQTVLVTAHHDHMGRQMGISITARTTTRQALPVFWKSRKRSCREMRIQDEAFCSFRMTGKNGSFWDRITTSLMRSFPWTKRLPR